MVLNLRVPYSPGELLSACTFVGISRRAWPHGVSYPDAYLEGIRKTTKPPSQDVHPEYDKRYDVVKLFSVKE